MHILLLRAAMSDGSFTYERDVPIEAGRLQLYRDGSYIGMAALPSLLPGSDVRVPFGVDERIRINVRDERALPIEVIDRVPVPQESDIKVEVIEGATAPTVRNLDGKEGVYLWKLPGTPKRTESIRHYYSVRYPSDRMLSPAEAGG